MALHKKAEFAEICGITTSNITQYIKRGKLIPSGDYIDDSIDPNKSFLKKRLELLKIKEYHDEPAPDPQKKPTAGQVIKEMQYKPPVHRIPIVPNVEPTDKHIKKNDLFNLDMEQKELDIEQSREVLELTKIKKEKAMGLVVPTPQVKNLIAQLGKSFTTAFYNTSDVILSRLAKKYGISIEDVAALRGELRQDINKSVGEAVTETKLHLKNIVNEYSERRGVGEKI